MTKANGKVAEYRVQSILDLKTIIAHFDQYPMITEK